MSLEGCAWQRSAAYIREALIKNGGSEQDFYEKILSEPKDVYKKNKDGKYVGEEVKYSVKAKSKKSSKGIEGKI